MLWGSKASRTITGSISHSEGHCPSPHVPPLDHLQDSQMAKDCLGLLLKPTKRQSSFFNLNSVHLKSIWMFPFRWLVILNCVFFCIFASSRFLSARKKSFTDKNPKGATSWDTTHTDGTPKGQKVSECEWVGTESKTCVQEQLNGKIKPFPGWKRRSSAWRRYTLTRTINPPQATGKERVYFFFFKFTRKKFHQSQQSTYVSHHSWLLFQDVGDNLWGATWKGWSAAPDWSPEEAEAPPFSWLHSAPEEKEAIGYDGWDKFEGRLSVCMPCSWHCLSLLLTLNLTEYPVQLQFQFVICGFQG